MSIFEHNPREDNVTILVGGDVQPIGRNGSLFQDGDAQALFTDLNEELNAADFVVVNLESPFVLEKTSILKTGPIFNADISCIKGFVAAGIDGVNLSNNHIMDHGETGLSTTLQVLQENNLLFFGAGKNLEEAGRLSIITLKGKRIGFLGMADREFSIASTRKPGANPTDLIEFVRKTREQRAELDFLLVLMHEGVQHFHFPTPELQKRCRFLVEEGADAVICQHSHCPGCYEIYRGRPIVYGQGDLLSDSKSKRKDDSGFLVKISLEQSIQISVIPYWQLADGGVRRMTTSENMDFFSTLERRNELLKDADALETEWRTYCRSLRDAYFSQISGFNRGLRYLNRKLHFIENIKVERAAVWLNLIRCSAHREALEMIFSDILLNKRD